MIHRKKQNVSSQGIAIILSAFAVLFGALYLKGPSAQNVIFISLVGTADVTDTMRDSYRVVCKFTYVVKNQLEEEALVGPFTMKVANAQLPVAIAPVPVGPGERYLISAKGVHKLPCTQYKMDPWLDVHSCSTKSGLNCLDAVKYQKSREGAAGT